MHIKGENFNMNKKIAIIGAMKSEISVFCRDFDAQATDIPGVYRGSFNDKEIYTCLSGVGKVNAAISVQKLIDTFDIDCIINSGIAGGLSDKLAKLDIVISEQLTYHDFSPIDILDRYPPYSRFIKADSELIDKAETACAILNKKLKQDGEKTFNTFRGMIVSGDSFISSAEKAKQLHDEFGALCTEMEGAAVAHTAKVNNIPFVVIRAISDFADEDADNSFDLFEKKAAGRSAFIIKETLLLI